MSIFRNGNGKVPVSNAQPDFSGLAIQTATAAGTAIAADFSYAFVCRFLDDQEDFENIMKGLWKMQSLKFRSVRTS